MSTLDETFTPAEVGAALKERSSDWVERHVLSGKFEHLRVGRSMRFTADQATAFIQAFTVRTDGTRPAETSDPLRSQTSASRTRSK